MKAIGVNTFINKRFDTFAFVENFRIKMPRSRFGGNKEFVIWNEGKTVKKNAQPSLFDTE